MADLSAKAWNTFSTGLEPSDKISKNFRVYELTKSETADRLSIDNSFKTTRQVRCAVYLCRQVLQPVRKKFGSFSPNSVFRGQALERGLKLKPKSWTSTSQHTKGQACDIEVAGVATMKLAQWVQDNLNFDQLILECYNQAKGVNSGWVHISLVPPGMGKNRKKVLSYVFDPAKKKYTYVTGLQESP